MREDTNISDASVAILAGCQDIPQKLEMDYGSGDHQINRVVNLCTESLTDLNER